MKKILSIMLVLAMTAGLAACGSSSGGEPAMEAATEVATETDIVEDIEETTDVDEPATEDLSYQEDSTVTYYTMNSLLYGFSDGIAWVKATEDENGDEYIVAINQNAEIIYRVDEDCYDGDVYVTCFMNGYSVVYHGDEPKFGSVDSSYPGFKIIDTNGDVVYESDEFYFCGQGEYGDFLVAEHVSNFDEDAWYAYLLDSEMTLSDPMDLDANGWSEDWIRDAICDTTEWGPGVFFTTCDGYHTINFNYRFYAKIWDVNEVCDTYIVTNPEGHEYCFIPKSVIVNATTSEEVDNIDNVDGVSRMTFINEYPNEFIIKNSEEPTYVVCKESYANGYYDASLMDENGNVIFTYPELPDEAYYKTFGRLENGYSVVYMSGADGKIYVTAIDEDGNRAYDPVACSAASGVSCVGYAITDEAIIDLNGNELHIGDDLSGLDTGSYFSGECDLSSSYSHDFVVTISEGFIYFKVYGEDYIFSSLDGNQTINQLTLTYNSDYQIVFEGLDTDILSNKESLDIGTEEAIEESESTVSKNYVSLNSFSIEGKWKNVGSGTFGQAQSGSIIVFDGTNCNFFSPQDTYAFSKNGDNYKLECTGYMSTDTLTFTVKTVDEDNIDIYYGDTIVELTRVD